MQRKEKRGGVAVAAKNLPSIRVSKWLIGRIFLAAI
jgi:hypothetical protein